MTWISGGSIDSHVLSMDTVIPIWDLPGINLPTYGTTCLVSLGTRSARQNSKPSFDTHKLSGGNPFRMWSASPANVLLLSVATACFGTALAG